jgi:peptidoglycan hydrolase CwlO-like protein
MNTQPNGGTRWRYWGTIIAAVGVGAPALAVYVKNTSDIAVNHAEIMHVNDELSDLHKEITKLEDRINKVQCPGVK